MGRGERLQEPIKRTCWYPLPLLPAPKAKEPPSFWSSSKVLLTSEGWQRREEGEKVSEVGKVLLSLQATQPIPGSSLLRSLCMKSFHLKAKKNPGMS